MESNRQNAPLLQVQGLTVSFSRYAKGFRRVTLPGVRDLSFSLDEGELVAVVGASGSGKSLLAHRLLGILPHNAQAVSYTHLDVYKRQVQGLIVICLESNRYEKAVVALSLRRLFEYLTPYATTATSPASHQTTFEKYELAYQYMRFWRTFLYQHVCRCTHNVEHDSDIFYDVSVCYRQWYWRCGAFYGFLIARPAQRNESIHYVPQDKMCIRDSCRRWCAF